jgi:aryl-alcohol dehydrogenase-like predicted oxidoreductase
MQYCKLSNTDLNTAPVSLGTWAFGSDKWWGYQDDKISTLVLETAVDSGLTLIDTAPVYGRGHSEKVIGSFIRKKKNRQKVILATKLGLSWEDSSPKIFHDLSKKRMQQEIDLSRERLDTDYIDLYQVHWPDPSVAIPQTAEVMRKFYQKGLIKAIGVSNYSLPQIKEFIKYSPLHSIQPCYSMFNRSIESGILPFCRDNNIAVITYAPLCSGILTGKFFFDNVAIPSDINRKIKRPELEGERGSINRQTLLQLKRIADKYEKTLAQLAINWNFSQPGVTSAIVGIRNKDQLRDNLGSMDFNLSSEDMLTVNTILEERFKKISELKHG